ncbi:MAG: ABC transporter permease [Acidimicrobiales bacterium]|jgi:iron(III) transport system permease protein
MFWTVLVLVLFVPTACFLALSVSPRLFAQGGSWFTLSAFQETFRGTTLQGMGDSLLVGVLSALGASAIAVGLSWVMQRTTFPGRSLWSIGIWAILLVPSYIIAAGWQVVLGRGGILSSVGLFSNGLQSLFFGPAGYVLVLTVRGVPFAYFAIAGSLAALGRSYEDAARVHGAGRLRTLRTIGPVLSPAIFAAMIIVFAESISDFGTAAVIAPGSHFPVATYSLYTALAAYPANFQIASVIGLMLVMSVGVALFIQSRLTRGRSYTVLSGRTRPAVPRALGGVGTIGACVFMVGFFLVALVVPILGGVGASMLTPLTTFSLSHLTLNAYHGIFSSTVFGAPISLSLKLALITSFLALVMGALVARRISARRSDVISKVLNVTLVGAIALPAIVLAAGFIFAYNLPILSSMGIDLYGTLIVLSMAYLAGSLPSTSRVLLGPMAQVHASLLSAARVHGSGVVTSWRKAVVPLLSTVLIWAWLFAFATTFLELPASELLSPPGMKTVSVAIVQVLNKSDMYRGAALSVVALGIDLGVVAAVLVAFRVFSPKGWRRIGARGL